MSNPATPSNGLREALDRLAGAADADPVVDPVPGIRAEARRNRNRTTVLVSAGLAAAVVVAYAALSAGPGATRSDDSGIANSPSVSDSPSPSPSPSGSASPLEPLETRQADVDGDGTTDRVRLMVPPGTAADEPSEEAWLEVRTASGTHTVQVTDSTTYVGFYDSAGLVDLDGNGASEILLFETGGGESGALTVWIWDGPGDELLPANFADGTPRVLVSSAGLAVGGEELGVAFQDGALYSWQVVEPGSHEVTVWKWLLDGGIMGAFRQPGTQCISFGVLEPC